METVFHVIIFILFIGVCFCAGYSLSSCIRIDKKLRELNKTQKEVSDAQLKLIKLLEEENHSCKDVINHCKTVIDDNKTLLSHTDKVINLVRIYLVFIKQNMIRRKTPIVDE